MRVIVPSESSEYTITQHDPKTVRVAYSGDAVSWFAIDSNGYDVEEFSDVADDGGPDRSGGGLIDIARAGDPALCFVIFCVLHGLIDVAVTESVTIIEGAVPSIQDFLKAGKPSTDAQLTFGISA